MIGKYVMLYLAVLIPKDLGNIISRVGGFKNKPAIMQTPNYCNIRAPLNGKLRTSSFRDVPWFGCHLQVCYGKCTVIQQCLIMEPGAGEGKKEPFSTHTGTYKEGVVGPGLSGLFPLEGDWAAGTGACFFLRSKPPCFRDRDNAVME